MSEHDEQTALMRWASYNTGQLPALARLFAIPNGGHRAPSVASYLKAEGVKAGVPDLFLPVPRLTPGCERYGLFVEMKYGRNRPRKEQCDWHAYLRDVGYEVVVPYGWQEAARAILAYLDVDENDARRLLGE